MKKSKYFYDYSVISHFHSFCSSSIKVTKGKECISLSKEKIPLLLEDDKANSLNGGRKEKV